MNSDILEELATELNFEEDAYLSANPDVAQAVKNGLFRSGREHFDTIGKKEGRKICQKVSCENICNLFGLISTKQRFEKHFNQDVIRIRFLTEYPVCNYSCEYCVVGQYNKSELKHNFNVEQYLKIIDAIIQLPFSISIRVGVCGEFFLSKDLIEGGRLLSNARNIKHLNLITNLSFDYKRYTELLKGYNHQKIAIVASYHPTQIRDKRKWLDTALQINKEFDFAVILVAYPPLLRELPLLVNELKQAGLEVFIQGFIGNYDNKQYPYSYTAEEKTFLKEIMYSRHDYEFFINCKKPGLCNAGYKSLYINKDGEVFSCGMGKGMKLGNLLKSTEIYFFNSPRPCTHETCLCDTEYINTLIFEQHYFLTGINQHKYSYKFRQLSKYIKELDEWEIAY
jgi:MoaA/NifB/PqqE/SkfB family radical SAM enzyme